MDGLVIRRDAKVIEGFINNRYVEPLGNTNEEQIGHLFGNNKVYSMKIHYLYLAIWI